MGKGIGMEQQGAVKHTLAGIQWLFFMFANTIVIPLTIGHAFDLSSGDIATSIQRAFILTGTASLLQVWIGHRWILLEGQSGLWWGVIISLCASAPSMGLSLPEVGASMITGIVLSGITIIVMGLFGVGDRIKKWFTPHVMFVIIFLIASQLIFIFAKGMLGLNAEATVHPMTSLFILAVIVLVLLLTLAGPAKLRNFAILIGIIVGWIFYTLIFGTEAQSFDGGGQLWTPFTWGSPWEVPLNGGIVAVTYLTGLLNLSNTMAAMKGSAQLFGSEPAPRQYRGGFIVTGFMNILAGIFGVVPYGTYASTIGFLQATRILNRIPFMIGASGLILFGFVPQLAEFFSTLPLTVGNAVLFVAYLSMMNSALTQLRGITFTSRTIYRVALPAFIGLSWMTFPSTVWTEVPLLIQPLISNGLLLGIILTLLVNHLIPWGRMEEQDRKESQKAEKTEISEKPAIAEAKSG